MYTYTIIYISLITAEVACNKTFCWLILFQE